MDTINFKNTAQGETFKAYLQERGIVTATVNDIPGGVPHVVHHDPVDLGSLVTPQGTKNLMAAAEFAAALDGKANEVSDWAGQLLLDAIQTYRRNNTWAAPEPYPWAYNGWENPDPKSPLGNSVPFAKPSLLDTLRASAQAALSTKQAVDRIG